MIERLVSFWDCLFLRAMLNFRGSIIFSGKGYLFQDLAPAIACVQTWSNYCRDRKNKHEFNIPKGWWFSKGNGTSAISGKSRSAFSPRLGVANVEEQENLGWWNYNLARLVAALFSAGTTGNHYISAAENSLNSRGSIHLDSWLMLFGQSNLQLSGAQDSAPVNINDSLDMYMYMYIYIYTYLYIV